MIKMIDNAVMVENLEKSYRKIKAVDGISFSVPEGEVFGLLGPNGAGKTTTIRILLTLIQPSAGSVLIFGMDTRQQSDKIRQMAGYVPQGISVDGELTAYENMLIYAKLYGLPSANRKKRINEVLEYIGLEDRANDMVKTYSGGMMRRLELAQSLINSPKILFLDEPSIGLDPNARNAMWEMVRKLRQELGTTIFLTTHDMVEADTLCDRIGIMDRGKLVIVGTPSDLKANVGGDVITVSAKNASLSEVIEQLGYQTIGEPSNGTADLLVKKGEKAIPRIVESFKEKGVELDSVFLKKPTLDDVFLKYTGSRIDDGAGWAQAKKTRMTYRRMAK
ncbi:MAG: ATP-binding cassette domain-containing protein [Dehalococcoidales bacterium]